MINIIQEKQKIYEIYRMLEHTEGDYTAVESQATFNLFTALNLYYGAPESEDSQQQLVKEIAVTLLVFYFTETELFDEVFKRTSYIAKTRRDKETKQHLLDVIALTADDTSIFDPYLKGASSTLFADTLQAFSRNVSGAYLHLYPSGITEVENKTYTKGDKVLFNGIAWELTGADSVTVTGVENGFDTTNWTEKDKSFYTDDKVEFVLLRPDWFNMNMAVPSDKAMFEAMVSYVMWKWFILVFPEEANTYKEEFERQKQYVVSGINSNNRPLNRRHRMF